MMNLIVIFQFVLFYICVFISRIHILYEMNRICVGRDYFFFYIVDNLFDIDRRFINVIRQKFNLSGWNNWQHEEYNERSIQKQ